MHSAKSFASTLLGFSLLLLFTLLLTVAWNVQAGQDDAEGDGTSAEITKSSDREPVENGNGGNEATGRSDFPPIFNTQEIGDTPLLPPEEALATIQVPDGFQVELFAAEPDVQQPIAMATDGRGRLWVAENYTYAESGVNFDSRLRDRIIILEDTTGDGKADRRTVFWDQAEKLTSIEIGFGGVWALCAPHLLFIPDADGDDQPDGEPIVVLDGWDENAVRHNIVNGLRWGPDGWLYGRHGILATSRVAAPGTPDHLRTSINCGIWRYHPTREIFETVAHGTTNPWGMDWDEHGQMFFINTVIGHLWHVIPGAHYQRMYGEDLRPHLYELLPQTADHVHWDTAENWSDVGRGLSGSTDMAGGGHAHSGLMIYQGDNWPESYRGACFTLNLHGRRINQDQIIRQGATYTATHAPDLFHVGDLWFRGLELISGPDGGVFVADWSDIGECHENDGVHRTSGRIYKLTYGTPKAQLDLNLDQAPSSRLADLLTHPNDWFSRQARRILQHRAEEGKDLSDVVQQLRTGYSTAPAVTDRLRLLWGLQAVGALSNEWLIEQLEDDEEHIRTWSVKFLSDTLLSDSGPHDPAVESALVAQAERDPSGLVQVFLASALQRLPAERRWDLGAALLSREDFADDPYLNGMLWYGLEPAVLAAPERAAQEAIAGRFSKVRRFVARRLTQEYALHPEWIDKLLKDLSTSDSPETARDVLSGMTDAFRGWRKAEPVAAWNELNSTWVDSADERVRELAREIAVLFGDGRAIQQLLEMARSDDTPLDLRRDALRSLVEARHDEANPLLRNLLGHRDLAVDAIRGLAAMPVAENAGLLVSRYRQLPPNARRESIQALASRPAFARELVSAVQAGTIRRGDVTSFQIRQIRGFGDEQLDRTLDEIWPEFREDTRAKARQIADLRQLLSDDVLADGDRRAGRHVFQRVCATCHVLFGAGGDIGPDLTGGQRSNLTYLLENILDPSAQVAENYRMSILVMVDGRVINGVVSERTRQTLTVQTPTERLVLPLDEIEEVRDSQLSMMPDQLLEPLSPTEIRDLFAYLMGTTQVELPEGVELAEEEQSAADD